MHRSRSIRDYSGRTAQRGLTKVGVGARFLKRGSAPRPRAGKRRGSWQRRHTRPALVRRGGGSFLFFFLVSGVVVSRKTRNTRAVGGTLRAGSGVLHDIAVLTRRSRQGRLARPFGIWPSYLGTKATNAGRRPNRAGQLGLVAERTGDIDVARTWRASRGALMFAVAGLPRRSIEKKRDSSQSFGLGKRRSLARERRGGGRSGLVRRWRRGWRIRAASMLGPSNSSRKNLDDHPTRWHRPPFASAEHAQAVGRLICCPWKEAMDCRGPIRPVARARFVGTAFQGIDTVQGRVRPRGTACNLPQELRGVRIF